MGRSGAAPVPAKFSVDNVKRHRSESAGAWCESGGKTAALQKMRRVACGLGVAEMGRSGAAPVPAKFSLDNVTRHRSERIRALGQAAKAAPRPPQSKKCLRRACGFGVAEVGRSGAAPLLRRAGPTEVRGFRRED